MSSKDVASLVPMFNGAEYHAWKEQMGDFLGSQRMLGFINGDRPRPVPADPANVTAAERQAVAQWVEDNTVVKSYIALRLSPNLHTHIGNTAEETWESLETTFGVSHFTMDFRLLQEVMKAKLRVDQNPQVEIQQIWTLLERICIVGLNLDNYLQAMLLLFAIPKEWDRIASMYCKDMTRSWASFEGVRTAIMQENHGEDEPLDWGTPSDHIQDPYINDVTDCHELTSEDSVGKELAKVAGISCLSLTPAPF